MLGWEDNTHVPMLMGYKGLAKVVRYQKAAGGSNDDAFPKYVELFYYSQADSDGFNPSQQFIDAEADRAAKWTDAQLSINPIVKGVLAFPTP